MLKRSIIAYWASLNCEARPKFPSYSTSSWYIDVAQYGGAMFCHVYYASAIDSSLAVME